MMRKSMAYAKRASLTPYRANSMYSNPILCIVGCYGHNDFIYVNFDHCRSDSEVSAIHRHFHR
jgi:hypothetical protein